MHPTPTLIPFDIEILLRRRYTGEGTHVSDGLSAVARRIARSFLVTSPFAPDFCCVGAEVLLDATDAAANGSNRLSATGNGCDLNDAATSCLGEAADLTSQFERPGDVLAQGGAAELGETIAHGWIAGAIRWPGRPIDWVRGTDARSGRNVRLPADLCLRREPTRRVLDPVGALSSGVAAGRDRETATLRAVLELCERDALALWWLWGRRARTFPIGHPASEAGHALLLRLRQGGATRITRFLDLSTDLAVPTVAAISTDLDGFSLACGAAARLDPAEAARAAVLELCQMELSAPLADAKRAERGEDALNNADRRHLRRAAHPTTDLAALIPEEAREPLEGFMLPTDLAGLVERLYDHGIDVYLADLTRPDVGVPVVRAVAPDLQPFAMGACTRRSEMARVASETLDPPNEMILF